MFTTFKYFIIPIISKNILKVIGISNAITKNEFFTDISLENCYILDNLDFQKEIKCLVIYKSTKEWSTWFG
jgi:hypothetical protein